MEQIILNIINQLGYIGVFLLIMIENVFPPIPSEVILTFGGFLTTYTNMEVNLFESALSEVCNALSYRCPDYLEKTRKYIGLLITINEDENGKLKSIT